MATTISTNRPSLDRTASFPNTSVEQECLSSCPCKSVLWGNITSLKDLSPTKLAELNKKIKQLKSQLSVNKTALSTYKAKKISASDDRSSAAGIGTIGIAIIVIVVLMIAIADVTSFLPSKHRVHSTSCRARGMKQRMESRM
ncbi:uncharacterized protein [Argopecten irradians]|uniref:uncharacterized protein n=1 Tax=Argopecten irradians TaxID=31199 RepID=UPI0037106906